MKLLIGSFTVAFLLAFVWGVVPFFVPSLAHIASVRILEYSISAIELGLFSLVCLFVLGMWMILQIPPELHYQQLNKISDLDSQLHPDVKPLIVTEYEDKVNHREIGIYIDNQNNYILEHPLVKLVDLIWLAPNGERRTIGVSQRNRGFRTGSYFHSNDHIPAHDHAILIVANAGNDMIEFLLETKFERAYSYDPDTNMPYGIGESDYEIQLYVRGEIGQHRLEESPTLVAHFKSDGRDIRLATVRLVNNEKKKPPR